MWCQLFSEPQAGSDLASLNARADKVDGGWSLTGQKVWTSDAHHAHWAICLARTEFDVPKKHRGLSYFLVDMGAPGVTVRPLKQPSGDSHFNEVFLDDVFLPDDQLLGERGEGWALTMTTLLNERTTISSVMTLHDDDRVREIVEKGLYSGDRRDAIEALGQIVAETTGVAALNYRESVRQLHGDLFSPGASVVKVASAELSRTTSAISLDLVGPEASLRHAPRRRRVQRDVRARLPHWRRHGGDSAQRHRRANPGSAARLEALLAAGLHVMQGLADPGEVGLRLRIVVQVGLNLAAHLFSGLAPQAGEEGVHVGMGEEVGGRRGRHSGLDLLEVPPLSILVQVGEGRRMPLAAEANSIAPAIAPPQIVAATVRRAEPTETDIANLLSHWERMGIARGNR